jgi:hypothetical protein
MTRDKNDTLACYCFDIKTEKMTLFDIICYSVVFPFLLHEGYLKTLSLYCTGGAL